MARPTHFSPEPAVALVMTANVSETRRLAGESLGDDVEKVGLRHRPRMLDLDRRNHLDRLADILLAHAQPFQSGRQAEADIEIVKAARRIADAEGACDAPHRLGRGV